MIQDLKFPSLLVAMPQLQDSHFQKCVVLLVEHSVSGAFGFIVNRPGEVPLKEILDVGDVHVPDEIFAWYGGPVDPASGVILSDHGSEEDEIGEGVTLSTSESELIKLIEGSNPMARRNQLLEHGLESDPLYPFRFLVGYSGWAPGQLEEELRLGAWIQTPLNRDLLFKVSYDQMWEMALNGVGAQAKNLVSTAQPYLN